MAVQREEPLLHQILSQALEQEGKVLDRMSRVIELLHQPLAEKNRGVLSFSQHWTLFANYFTLYQSQKTLHSQLGDCLAAMRTRRASIVKHKQAIQRMTETNSHNRQPSTSVLSRVGSFPPLAPLLGRTSSLQLEVNFAPTLEGNVSKGGDVPKGAANTDAADVVNVNAVVAVVVPALKCQGDEVDATSRDAWNTPEQCAAHDDNTKLEGVVTSTSGSLSTDLLHPCMDTTLAQAEGTTQRENSSCSRDEVHHDDDKAQQQQQQPSSLPQLQQLRQTSLHSFQASGASDDAFRLVSDDEEDEEDSGDVQRLLDVFCGSPMMHFMAEHMMYILHCSKTIFPTLTLLMEAVVETAIAMRSQSRFGDSLPFGFRGSGGGSGAAPVTQPLLLANNGGGGGGGAAGPQVPSTSPPPPGGVTPARLADVPPHLNAILTKFNRFVHFSSQVLSQSLDDTRLEKVFLPENCDPLQQHVLLNDAAPLEELLLHMAAPLSSLQRYLHLSRCILEGRCLADSAAHTLNTQFVTTSFARCAEEGTLVLDQIAQQDVARTIATFDAFDAPPNESRVLLHAGRLVKRFRRGRHERLMYVFSDLLCYVEENGGPDGKHRVRGMIPLDTSPEVQLFDRDDNPDEQIVNAIELVASTGVRYLFFVPSVGQKRTWLDVFRFALGSARRAKSQQAEQKVTGDVPSLVRSQVQSLPPKSRLERQRREDDKLHHIAHRKQQHSSRVASVGSVRSTGILSSPSLVAAKHSSLGTLTPVGSMRGLPQNQLSDGRNDFMSRVSVRRQASLRGSFSVAHWDEEMTAASLTHHRVRSADLLGALKHEGMQDDGTVHCTNASIEAPTTNQQHVEGESLPVESAVATDIKE